MIDAHIYIYIRTEPLYLSRTTTTTKKIDEKKSERRMQTTRPLIFKKNTPFYSRSWFKKRAFSIIILLSLLFLLYVTLKMVWRFLFSSVTRHDVMIEKIHRINGQFIDPSLYQSPISWHPRVFKVKKLLSPEECDNLIQLSANKLTAPDKYNSEGSFESLVFRSIHSGKKAVLKRQDTEWLDKRIAKLLHIPKEYGEDIVVQKLEKGDKELNHVDYYTAGESHQVDKMLSQYGNRLATLIIYLNKDYAGGNVKFKTVPPIVVPNLDKGDALLYYNINTDGSVDPLTEHESDAIEFGEKWIATKWLRQKPWLGTRE